MVEISICGEIPMDKVIETLTSWNMPFANSICNIENYNAFLLDFRFSICNIDIGMLPACIPKKHSIVVGSFTNLCQYI